LKGGQGSSGKDITHNHLGGVRQTGVGGESPTTWCKGRYVGKTEDHNGRGPRFEQPSEEQLERITGVRQIKGGSGRFLKESKREDREK